MPHVKRPTFRDIVAEVQRAPRQLIDVRPGSVNGKGQLFDPHGRLLTKDHAQITPADAAEQIRQGALLAFEGCGCGGSGACSISWIDAPMLRALRETKPTFVKGYGSPTWIDLWSGDGVAVVFAHGDVEWGDALPIA
jgi:hypothetical protein